MKKALRFGTKFCRGYSAETTIIDFGDIAIAFHYPFYGTWDLEHQLMDLMKEHGAEEVKYSQISRLKRGKEAVKNADLIRDLKGYLERKNI